MNLSSGKIHHNGLPSCYVSLCLTSAWKTIYRIYGCNEMSSSMVIQQNHSAIFLSIIFFQCVPCLGDFRLKFNTSNVWTKQILFVTKFFSESLISTWKRWRINRGIMETIGHDCIFVYYFNFTDHCNINLIRMSFLTCSALSYDDVCLAVLSLIAHREATALNPGGVFTSLSSNRLNHNKQEKIDFKHKNTGTVISVIPKN